MRDIGIRTESAPRRWRADIDAQATRERSRDSGNGLRHVPRERLDEFVALFDFRLAVECRTAWRAAARRMHKDLVALAGTLDAMRQETSIPLFRRADSAFHLAVADAARNALLRRAVEDVRTTMFLPTDPIDALDFTVVLDSTLEGHRCVLAAIAARDGPTAERAMAVHSETTRHELHAILDTRDHAQ